MTNSKQKVLEEVSSDFFNYVILVENIIGFIYNNYKYIKLYKG